MTTEPLSQDNDLSLSISRAEVELARLLDWVRAAESRLALILPLSTAMLSGLAILAPSATQWTVFGGIISSFSATFLILSVVFAAFAFFPRTTGPKGSLIYFGGIVTRDVNQYAEEFRSVNSEAFFVDLIRQCHRNAQIADRKFAWVQRAMTCLLLAILPWLGSIFILYSASA